MFFLKWIDIVMHSKTNGKSIWSCYIFVMFHRIMPVLSKFNYVHPRKVWQPGNHIQWKSRDSKHRSLTPHITTHSLCCRLSKKRWWEQMLLLPRYRKLDLWACAFQGETPVFFLYFCIGMVLCFIYRTFIKHFLSSRFSYSHQCSSLKCDCLELP